MVKKVMAYKDFIIAELIEGGHHEGFLVYTKEEWSYGQGYRTEEWEAGTIQEAKDFIDSY